MKIFFDRAEDRLVETLARIRGGYGNACCLHIRGRGMKDRNFTQLPTLIGQWIGQHDDGMVLVCRDRDVFVFAPTVDFNLFVKFKDRFLSRFNEPGLLVDPGQVCFYDVRINGAGLIEMAEAKREREAAAHRLREEDALRADREKRRESILSAPLNEELLQTLERRREERGRLNVMVVEDDPFSRKLIGNALGAQFAVSFAEDGRGALSGHLKTAPDIVFLDIDLPDISGHDVLCRIMQFDPGAYIVMLSGNSDMSNIMRAVNAGARGFVGKPFAREKLLQYINRCPARQLQPTGA